MHQEHKNILSDLKKHLGKGTQHTKNDRYILSGHFYYDISVPVRRQIAKDWLSKHESISSGEFLSIVDSLYRGESHDEKMIASYLLEYHHSHRKKVTLKQIDTWLDQVVGWAEIDSFCVYSADELLADWTTWKAFIKKLANDNNINKRRAALVLLTGPVRKSDNIKLRDLAFQTIDKLSSEKPIIITKAISWLLRNLSLKHKQVVADYLVENQNVLPKIALRETWRKIKTGRK